MTVARCKEFVAVADGGVGLGFGWRTGVFGAVGGCCRGDCFVPGILGGIVRDAAIWGVLAGREGDFLAVVVSFKVVCKGGFWVASAGVPRKSGKGLNERAWSTSGSVAFRGGVAGGRGDAGVGAFLGGGVRSM